MPPLSQSPLLSLMHAIASNDVDHIARALPHHPQLAIESLVVGASRESSNEHFLSDIRHHVYAGDTALHVAAAAQSLTIVDQLIALGANVAAANRRGQQPLHYAVDGKSGEVRSGGNAQAAVIERLIRAGANPNCVDKSGVSPLHRAVRNRSSAAVRVLLEHGADANARNKSGSLPLDLTKSNTGKSGSGSAIAVQEKLEIVRLLMTHSELA